MSNLPFIHPETRQMLDRAAASSEPPLETLPPIEARRIADARVAGGIAPVELSSVRDIGIAAPHGDMTLRLYRETDAVSPFTMFFHGGGFMFGNLDTHDGLCRRLVKESGVALVSVDFRRSPEHPFPAAPDDCLFATLWVLEHARTLNLNPERFAVAGESSGGCLAATVAQRLISTHGARPRLQALLYPMLDTRMNKPSMDTFGSGYLLTRGRIDYYLRHYLSRPQDVNDPAAAPGRFATQENTPPTFLLSAGLDPLRSDADDYASRLEHLKVPLKYVRYEGWPHGFLFWGHTAGCRRAIGEIATALRQALQTG